MLEFLGINKHKTHISYLCAPRRLGEARAHHMAVQIPHSDRPCPSPPPSPTSACARFQSALGSYVCRLAERTQKCFFEHWSEQIPAPATRDPARRRAQSRQTPHGAAAARSDDDNCEYWVTAPRRRARPRVTVAVTVCGLCVTVRYSQYMHAPTTVVPLRCPCPRAARAVVSG